MVTVGDEGRQDLHQVQSVLVDLMATWCETVFGNGALNGALGQLCDAVEAEAGLLVRHNVNESLSLRVAGYDARERAEGVRPLVKPFCRSHFGQIFDAARPGTMWLGSSVLAENGSGSLSDWQRSRRMREFVVIVLTAGTGVRDHIELHFRDSLSPQTYSSLAVLAPTLGRSWAMRRAGLVAGALAAAHSINATTSNRNPLLSPGNPARLSRAEFRICVLLSQGLSAGRVAHELAVAETTVRSHLRNIYAKSQTESLADLVYHLMAKSSDLLPSRDCA